MIDPSKPPMHISADDYVRVRIAQNLGEIMAQCLVMPVRSDGRFQDLADVGVEVARILDGMHFDSDELRGWFGSQSQESCARRLADLAKAGDVKGMERYAKQLMFQHPLPVLMVDTDDDTEG